MKNILILFVLTMIITCKTDEKKSYDKFLIDKNLAKSDTIQLLSKFPELKLYRTDINESKTRSAYIIQTSSALNMAAKFDNYKCKAKYENDTLNIYLNNNNRYFGNGVLIKVFDGQYFIKDFDPKTLKGEEKFLPSKAILQKLTLNDDQFKKNDSIYGSIYYHAIVDNHIDKEFKGYFRTKIK